MVDHLVLPDPFQCRHITTPPRNYLSFMYFPVFTLRSSGFFASVGIAQQEPNFLAPSIRPAAQIVWSLRTDKFHFSATSCIVIYSIAVPLHRNPEFITDRTAIISVYTPFIKKKVGEGTSLRSCLKFLTSWIFIPQSGGARAKRRENRIKSGDFRHFHCIYDLCEV